MAIYDGGSYNGLSSEFRNRLQLQEPAETLSRTDGTKQRIWAKEGRPSYQAKVDPKKRLLDQAAVDAAKQKEFVPPFSVRILAASPDLTLDDSTEFSKQVVLEGFRGRDTIRSLKDRLLQDGLASQSPRIFLPPHELRDATKLGECFAQWSGFGLENWPPKFVMKPMLQGFEVSVTVPASLQTATWGIVDGKTKLKAYGARRLLFDLRPETTVAELKKLLEKKLAVSADRQVLSAELAEEFDSGSTMLVDLDSDDLTMKDYGVDRLGQQIYFGTDRLAELDALLESEAA